MTIVRFAMTCDCCGERSDEYAPYPICLECGNDVCEDCISDFREPDEGNERGSGYCRACMIEAARERYWDHKIHARIDGDF